MGYIKKQWILALIVGQSEGRQELDKFIQENTKFFTKSQEMTNGYTNYVMYWDGSKEGWDSSNMGDVIRGKFIRLLNGVEGATIYEITDDEHRDNPEINKRWICPKQYKSLLKVGSKEDESR